MGVVCFRAGKAAATQRWKVSPRATIGNQDAKLARQAGVAPLDASSGKHQRHRLDRGRNRQLNSLHRIAITQGRVHPPARASLERKQAEGKSRREAIRCLKHELARTIYVTLRNEPLLT